MCETSYPVLTSERFRIVFTNSPAPTSKANVSAVWVIVTARKNFLSAFPVLLFGPALFSASAALIR
jgi:hypothetical protein